VLFPDLQDLSFPALLLSHHLSRAHQTTGQMRSILGRIKRGWRTSSRRRISRAGGRRFARRPRQGRRWRARAERGHDHSQRASHCQGWIVG
jgi:hypothetical protein